MRHTIHRTNSTLASLILIALLGVCAIGVAQVDTWTRKADLPTPSQALSASVVNGKIYAIGGSGRVRRRSVVEAYDPAVDTWTRKPDMPTPRRRHNTRVLDGKIYAIGGQDSDGNPFSAMEVYDPSTDTWTRKADIPTLRHNFSISVVDGRIYVIGGSIPVDNEFRPLSTVEAYDPATDTWTRKSDMPTPRGFLSTSLVNGKIYAIGGWDGINPISTVEAYGPQTDIWTRKVDMPTPRSDLTTHVGEREDLCDSRMGWKSMDSNCRSIRPSDRRLDAENAQAHCEWEFLAPGQVHHCGKCGDLCHRGPDDGWFTRKHVGCRSIRP